MTDDPPQVHPHLGKVTTARFDTVELLLALKLERAKNRKLRRRIREVEASRDEWKGKAKGVGWSARALRRRASRQGQSHAPSTEQ